MDIIFRGRNDTIIQLITHIVIVNILELFLIHHTPAEPPQTNQGDGAVPEDSIFTLAFLFTFWWTYNTSKIVIYAVRLFIKISAKCGLVYLICLASYSLYQLHLKWSKERNSFTPPKYQAKIGQIAIRMRRQPGFKYRKQSRAFDEDHYKQCMSEFTHKMVKRCDRIGLPKTRNAMLKRGIMGLQRKYVQWTMFVVKKFHLNLKYAHRYHYWTTHWTLDTKEIALAWFELCPELRPLTKFKIACNFCMEAYIEHFYQQLSEKQQDELVEDPECAYWIYKIRNFDLDAITAPEWWRRWCETFRISNDLEDVWRETQFCFEIYSFAGGLSQGNWPKAEHYWKQIKSSQKPTILRHLSRIVKVAGNGEEIFCSNDAIMTFLTKTLSEEQQKEVLHFLCEAEDSEVRPLIDLEFFSALFMNWPQQESAAHFLQGAKINKKLLEEILTAAVRNLMEYEDSMLGEDETLYRHIWNFMKDNDFDLDRYFAFAHEEFLFNCRLLRRRLAGGH